jgi:alpha-glucosidase
MYPELTSTVKSLIDFRYRLLPHLYNLLWRYHRLYDPIIRPTFFDSPHDDRCYAENDDMMLGSDLLVAAVVEPGATSRRIYLPTSTGWYDYWRGDYYEGGREIEVEAPMDRTPLFTREGCAIAVNLAPQHFAQRADERGFEIFPHRGRGHFECECFEDDGESNGYRQGRYWTWRLDVISDPEQISIQVDRRGAGFTDSAETRLLFPRNEMRSINLTSGQVVSDTVQGLHRDIRVALNTGASR